MLIRSFVRLLAPPSVRLLSVFSKCTRVSWYFSVQPFTPIYELKMFSIASGGFHKILFVSRCLIAIRPFLDFLFLRWRNRDGVIKVYVSAQTCFVWALLVLFIVIVLHLRHINSSKCSRSSSSWSIIVIILIAAYFAFYNCWKVNNRTFAVHVLVFHMWMQHTLV